MGYPTKHMEDNHHLNEHAEYFLCDECFDLGITINPIDGELIDCSCKGYSDTENAQTENPAN